MRPATLGPPPALSVEGAFTRVAPFAVVSRPLLRCRSLSVGRGALLRGSVAASGHLLLAAGARVLGFVSVRGDAVVGARARVEGPLRVGGRLLALDGARLAHATVNGAVVLRGALVEEALDAGGDLVAGWGALVRGTLRVAGRIAVGNPGEAALPDAAFSAVVGEALSRNLEVGAPAPAPRAETEAEGPGGRRVDFADRV